MFFCSCIPLSQCQPYIGLLNSVKTQNVVANKTKEDWMVFLSNHSCGLLANETKIKCPVEDGKYFKHTADCFTNLGKLNLPIVVRF